MRTAPVALHALGDDHALVDLAMTISNLTHADRLAGEACVLWCVAIDRAVREGHFEGIWDGVELLPADRQGYWAERLQEAQDGPPGRFNPNGFVVPALQAAISAIWRTPIPADQPCRHLQDALQTVIKVAGDTDTTAAIAGSMLGARWGASAIPVEWQLLLHGWPGYRAKDLVRLAVLTAMGGASDSSGWPAAESLTDHYRRSWPAEPFVQPLVEDEGVLLANFSCAREKLADVVVSLCRVGREDIKADQHAEVWLVDSPDPLANPNLDFVLSDLAKAIVGWRGDGKTVLVHCVQAQSRTPAVAAAYLAERLGISGAEALGRVRTQVPGAMVNRGFEEALGRVWPG